MSKKNISFEKTYSRHKGKRCYFFNQVSEDYFFNQAIQSKQTNCDNRGIIENRNFEKNSQKKYYYEEFVESSSIIKISPKRKLSKDSGNYSTSNEDSSPIVIVNKIKGQDFKTKYKTELCKYFEINGNCKFGDNCAYAHGKENLRSKVTNTTSYRTRKCNQFFENGFCPYGNRCQFAHALKSNIINNPYEKDMSYSKAINILSKIENVGNIKSFNDKGRLPIFEEITKKDKDINRKFSLFEGIKNLKIEDLYTREI